MKKLLIAFSFFFVFGRSLAQPITYTFTALAGTYNALVGPTAIPEIYWGADNELSGIYNIGFTFQFGCTSYTQFKVSADGWLTFNLGGSVSFADAINDLSGYAGVRPGIAPLWDDLAWNNNAPPQCGYQLSGASPNRILTVQWIKANWKISGAAPGEMSFQVKLYESTNRIEMIYHQESGALNAPSASIGLAGPAIGDYYSVNAAFSAATKVTNVQNIATKPAEGQIFRWDPPCATLPIELLYFTGENFSGQNNLHWSTATEVNNDHFTIERSADGSTFTEIGEVKGSGTSYTQKNYNFTDDRLPDGKNYYRLRQTDHNKKVSTSDIIVIDNDPKKHGIAVYPNPASTFLFVSGGSGQAFRILDISGKNILQGNLNSGPIDVSTLSKGFYFLSAGDGPLKKFIIQR